MRSRCVASLVLAACGGSGEPAPAPVIDAPPCLIDAWQNINCDIDYYITEGYGDRPGYVGALHQLPMTKEDVTTGATKAYAIRGDDTHDHSVTFTAEQFATMRSQYWLRVKSDSTWELGHFHEVQVRCNTPGIH